MITDRLAEPVLCAVSGGADSMYLLARLHELGYTVMAAHFNHGLRGAESDRDEAFVRGFCAEKSIAFFAGRGDVRGYAGREGMSLETAARELRYAFLQQTAESCGAGCIATAHTAGDNAETILFRLARGTGLRGLGGIPPVRGNVIRPMLDETRETVLAWLEANGVGYVEDSTNASDDYARNRIRHAVTPVLMELNAGFLDNAARTTALLREDEAFLQSLAERHVAEHGADAEALAEAPAPIAARAVRILFGEGLSETHIRAVLKLAREGGCADLPCMRIGVRNGLVCRVDGPVPELPERMLALGDTELPEAGMVLRMGRFCGERPMDAKINTFFFSVDAVCGTISVSARRTGDRMRPIGRACTKSLKQLFQEMGVEAWQRPMWPVLRDEKGVLAVYGIAADERTVGDGKNKNYITIEFLTIRKEDT